MPVYTSLRHFVLDKDLKVCQSLSIDAPLRAENPDDVWETVWW